MLPFGFSIDPDNERYREFRRGDGIIEYTLDGDEIAVDWVSGRNAAGMLLDIVEFEGHNVCQISGYVTDKLGSASDDVLERFGQQLAHVLGESWKANVRSIEGRRYLEFTKRKSSR